MARLNEPPVPADSLDTLRRRFLRQNRDIARINSNQSLRIRGLENECARLLSENLDLRGQVLHMEKELDERSSRRAADHALQLKEKMEVHLIELGALLAGFGLEPPTKKQPPSAHRRDSRPPRKSFQLHKRPPQLSPREAESLAAQEGRLAPIYENKTYPRQTLNREEILAIHSDAVDATDSPELGPPPISRLLRDESRRSMPPSPSKSPTAEVASVAAEEKDTTQVSSPSAPSTDYGADIMALPTPDPPRTMPATRNAEKQLTDTDSKLPLRGKLANRKPADPSTGSDLTASRSIPIPIDENNAVQVQRVGSKRKFAVTDENAVVRGMKTENNDKGTASGKGQLENGLPARELKNPKGVRDLVSSRKEGRSGARKPLAAKSTNDDISSPRKRPDDGTATCKSSASTDTNKNGAATGRMRDRIKMPVMLDNPDPLPPKLVEVRVDDGKEDNLVVPSTTAVGLENTRPISPSSHSESLCPNTPPSAAATLSSSSDRPHSTFAEGRDTPPPFDISSQGEVARPSRRARASVSYAEPNLRDKMRRPTKELLDAVAGEGRYLQRLGHQGPGETEGTKQQFPMSTPTKPQADHPTVEQQHEQQHEQQQEEPQPAPLRPVVMDRRKRAPSAEEPANAGGLGHESDPYAFTESSSPQSRSIESGMLSTDEEDSVVTDGKGGGGGGGDSSRRSISGSSISSRSSSKGTRRSSAAAIRDDASTSSMPAAAERPAAKTSATRKRTSMVAPKKASMLDEDDDEDDTADSSYEPATSSGEGEAQSTEGQTLSTRDRVSRRRSMML